MEKQEDGYRINYDRLKTILIIFGCGIIGFLIGYAIMVQIP